MANKIIDKIENQVKKYDFSKKFNRKFDLIVISPIYTQLIFPQLLTYLNLLDTLGFQKSISEFIKERFLEIMPTVISSFNNNIEKLINPSGFIIAMSDIFEANIEYEVNNKLSKIFDNINEMDAYYEKYVLNYGIGLGDFGLIDLENRYKLLEHKWLRWPFSEKKDIYVKIAIFKA